MGNGTSIGRVRGLGSAHHGAHHWLVQRTTAIGNVVLMAWLLASFMMMGDFGYASVAGWLAQPIAAVPMILLVISLFWHARLGLQVVIEDYLHNEVVKIGALVAVKFGCFVLGTIGCFAILKVAFGS